MDTTITSANANLTLIVPGLGLGPAKMEGFASDKAFVSDGVDLAETQMGVDGRMTAGFVFNPVVQTITLQADSPSRAFFKVLAQAMRTQREVFYISGSLAMPSTGEAFTMTRGIMTNHKAIADAMKVLQPVDVKITWERVDPSLL